MKFFIGEPWAQLMSIFGFLDSDDFYRGGVGLLYTSTLGGIITYLLFALFCILAIIGLVTVILLFRSRKKKEKDPYREWVRKGKYK
ncbi:MAG: hypothetical protein E7426_04120 [Ruminococcaceae bacterium]|nr:hypothetical protein [Oscillospiraceae bacterium]